MKIMHIETGRHIYGGARQVLFIMEGLKQLGVENILVCDSGAEIAAEAGDYAEVLEIPVAGDLDLGFINRLRANIRHHKPDIVHAHSRRGADWLGGLAAKSLGVPAVISRRVDNPESRLATKAKYRLFNEVIAISKGIGDVLLSQGLSPERLSIVPSAVQTQDYQGPFDRNTFLKKFGLTSKPEPIVIGVIAQLIKRKGHSYLLQCLNELAKKHPNIQVLFFGQGPLKEELEHEIEKLELTEIVSLVGFHTDLPTWIGCLDLVVHPAEMEGLGVSLLQAGAAGVSMVAASVGGIPEIILHEKTGLLIGAKNTEQLKTAVDRMLSDKSLRDTLGQAAKSHIEEYFSVNTMVEGNLAVYKKILALKN